MDSNANPIVKVCQAKHIKKGEVMNIIEHTSEGRGEYVLICKIIHSDIQSYMQVFGSTFN